MLGEKRLSRLRGGTADANERWGKEKERVFVGSKVQKTKKKKVGRERKKRGGLTRVCRGD